MRRAGQQAAAERLPVSTNLEIRIKYNASCFDLYEPTYRAGQQAAAQRLPVSIRLPQDTVLQSLFLDTMLAVLTPLNVYAALDS
jgi:hypothetical protein